MNKLRENTGVVLWILVISFGVIWVLQDSGAFDVMGTQSTRNFIVVDGDAITYEEYRQTLDRQLELVRQQTGQSASTQRTEVEEQRVFDALVEDRLRQHEMDRLGITVTDDEIEEMILGETPHPIIRTYFGNEEGEVDQALLQSFIDNPEASEQLIQLEAYLRAQRRQEKLDQLIASTVRISEQDVLDAYQQRNRAADAAFVALRYAALPNDSVTVTDRQLRQYYDDHREDFARERSYAIRFAALPKQPAGADTAALRQDLEGLRAEFAETEDDSLFLARYASERPFSSAYFTAADLDAAVADSLFPNPDSGQVVGPLLSGDAVHLVKVLDARPAEAPVVRARHILFRAPEGDEAQRTAAREQAAEALQQLQEGADFAALARQRSADPGSARRGGDLGWFSEDRMVEPFAEAAFGADVDEVVGPVETQFGVHLIQVTGRADQEVRIADYAQPLAPSPATLNDLEERLDDLRFYTEESGDLAGEAERAGLTLQEQQVEEGQPYLPGFGNSRALVDFLEDADVGDVSEVIELDDQFVVAYVDAITPAGYQPFEEVRTIIEPQATLAQKRAVQRARMEQALRNAPDLQALAEALGTEVQTASNVTFDNPVVSGLGREPAFAGTVLGLDEGERSGIVEGENAVFVARTTRIQEPEPITDAQRTALREELLAQRRSAVQQEWIAALREAADVEDNRRALLR